MAKCSSRKTCSLISDLMDANALNCKSCQKLLKTQVYLIDNVGNVCEECAASKKWTGPRNEIFDVLLKKLNIPCSYVFWGCSEEIPVAQYDQHLKTCKYRRIKCLDNRCTWMGGQDGLAGHFEKDHAENVVCSDAFNFELDLQMPSLFLTKLLIKRNVKYFLILKQDKEADEMTCRLFACRFVEGIKSSMEFSPGSAPALDTPQLRFNVAVKDLNSVEEQFCGQKISLTAFKHFLNDKHLINITVNVPPDEQLVKTLECPICYETMKPPMYQCAKGHTICNTCVEKLLRKCPTCGTPFGMEVRNYVLENLTSDVLYPCFHKAEGCEAVHLGSDIMNHESICEYQTYKCPLANCTYTYNANNVIDHLSLKHKDVTDTFECKINVQTYNIAGGTFPRHMFIKGCFFGCDYRNDNMFSGPRPRFEFRQLNFGRKLNNVYCKLTFENPETQTQLNYVLSITKFEPSKTTNVASIYVPVGSFTFFSGPRELTLRCKIFCK